MSRSANTGETDFRRQRRLTPALTIALAALVITVFGWSTAYALTLDVNDENGLAVTNYRWVVEEDATYEIRPGQTCKPDLDGGIDNCLSVQLHKSYMPVALSGASWNPADTAKLAALPADRRYFVSVLPGHPSDGNPTHQTGGAPVAVGQTAATVVVIGQPVPTAQIRVFAFLDNFPINNAPDTPQELPSAGVPSPMAGWRVLLAEAGGRYGIPGGMVLQDAFGNSLGTVYIPGTNGEVACENSTPGGPPVACSDAASNGQELLGNADLRIGDNGTLLIKNLPPAKYGIQIVPPEGQGWIQTTTIEGTKTIDAWVKPNEPPFLTEFGPPAPHVFMGFIRPQEVCFDGDQDGECGPDGTNTIMGEVRSLHLVRPPDVGFFDGRLFPNCLVALNDQAQGGRGVAIAECDGDSHFRFDNVPDGTYQMVIWDSTLDIIIDFSTVIVAGGETLNYTTADPLGPASVFPWYARTEFWVFDDKNADGFRDCFSDACDGTDPRDELGITEQAINLRFRDGTVYQSFPTDRDGYVPFDEIFPFFAWQVAEVDFLRFKATGATFMVDAGGPVDNAAEGIYNYGPPFDWSCPDSGADCPAGRGQLTPQPQCGDGSAPGGSFDLISGACLENAAAVNPHTGNNRARTETGVVLTQGYQAMAGNTNIMEFGKARYGRGENGGIAGIVFYAITRAENDPALAAAEEWEPGIARIKVNLYRDHDRDGQPDDLDGDGVVEAADIDNYPFGWQDGSGPRGPEDFDLDDPDHTLVDDALAVFDYGDAVNVAVTDSWDDDPPTGCQGETFYVCPSTHPRNVPCNPTTDPAAIATDCYDHLRNYNQVRPGVFDGGYAFQSELARDGAGDLILDGGEPVELSACFDAGDGTGAAPPAFVWPHVACDSLAVDPCSGVTGTGAISCEPAPLVSDTYIVEVGGKESGRHPVYMTLKEEDRNVDFGDEYVVSELLLPPPCVGERPYPVPNTFALWDLGEPPFRAGENPPLCDRKSVQVKSGFNAAADFMLLTEAPIAAHIVGLINNDLGNERNPQAPNFAEKFAPAYVPVSIRNWMGEEISRVYGDLYGRFNALVPSTTNANLPMPSGMSPNMLIACMNDPGWVENPNYNPDPGAGAAYDPRQFITDPYYDARFSRTCYTFQYMPGTTTYLDTPVIPVSAFAESDIFPVDCEFSNGTPGIFSINNLVSTREGPDADLGHTLEILSIGLVDVPDPRYDGTGTQTTITRNYKFGGAVGKVWVIDREIKDGVYKYPLFVQTWTGNRITARVPLEPEFKELMVCEDPAGAPIACKDFPARGQLVVEKSNGRESEVGVTLHVGGGEARLRVPTDYPTINAAIDAASPGDLILVAPGVYDELVIMWKPVQIQGWGAGSTIINATKSPAEKQQAWRDRINELVEGNFPGDPPGNCDYGAGPTACIDLLQPQIDGLLPFINAETNDIPALFTEEGPGVIVLGKNIGQNDGGFANKWHPQIDGLTIFGAIQGGAIVANGYNHSLKIGNNRMQSNQGFYNGGVRIGHPFLYDTNTQEYPAAINTRIDIHHNQIIKNGGLDGYGAGISVHHGSDRYEITDNFICGNFTVGSGGGIGHYGYSDKGRIADNTVVFNQVFNQGMNVHGGGIFVGGGDPIGGVGLSTGSGDVTIESNVILGNHAGAGDGGGVRLQATNGVDVEANNAPGQWDAVSLFNNMITNNVAGFAGAGISMQDAVAVDIVGNTITHNDSTATTADAFDPGQANRSTPQPSGIVSHAHSALLNGAIPANRQDDYGVFAKPLLVDNIIWNNRTFFWYSATDLSTFGLDPNTEIGEARQYWDLGVIGAASGQLDPQYCLLSNKVANFNPLTGTWDAPLNTRPMYGGATSTNQFVVPNGNVVRRKYENGDSDQAIQAKAATPPYAPLVVTTFSTVPALDEGGNAIDVRYGPLTLTEPSPTNPNFYRDIGEYHISICSRAKDNGVDLCGGFDEVCVDIDDEIRPQALTGVDIGADEDYDFCAAALTGTAAAIWERGLRQELLGDGNRTDTGTATAGPTVTDPGTGTKTVSDPIQPGTLALPAGFDYGQLDDPLPAGQGPAACDAVFGTTGGCTGLEPLCDSDNPGADWIGNTHEPGAVCMALSAGDGFSTMPDGRRLYQFGFRDVTGLPYRSNNPADRTLFDEGFIGSEFPGPTIALDQDVPFYLSLVNVGMQIRPDLFDPHTVHYHGFPNASAVFDGLPETGIMVNMGGTLTYYYNNQFPGTYMYHCHVEATEHMQMGMLGNLYVRPAQNREGCPAAACPVAQLGGNADPSAPMGYVYNDGDGSTGYDVEYPIQIGSYDSEFHDASEAVQPLPFALMTDDYPMLNGRGYPDTTKEFNFDNGNGRESQRLPTMIRAEQGDRVLLRISNLNVTRFYTLRVLGIPARVIGQDARLQRGPSGLDLSWETNSVILGGGESLELLLDTTDVEPGTYFLHAGDLNYLTNNNEDYGGMMTEIVVAPPTP